MKTQPNSTEPSILPWPVWAAMFFLLAFQVTAIAGLRGVPDLEGYLLNTSKKFDLGVFEDDGILSLHTALGYNRLHSDRFSYLLGIGGPVLHLAKPVMTGLDALGLIAKFKDPSLYLLYPGELTRAYKAYALYQLLAFTLWLPAAAYILLSRHVSRRAGLWGAWLLALTPFLTGFETRIKPDTPALLFGLLALSLCLDYLKSGGRLRLFGAFALFGLSMAIKFTCAPLGLVFIWLVLVRSGRAGEPWLKTLVQAVGVSLLVFASSNPLPLYGFGDIVSLLTNYVRVMHAPSRGGSDPGAAFLRLFDLRVFFGPVLQFAFPLMLTGMALRFIWRRCPAETWSVLLISCLLQISYLLVVTGSGFWSVTYYFYTAAVLGFLLLACCLDRFQEALRGRGAGWRPVGGALLIALAVLPLLADNLFVLNFVISPTNRQRVHSWVDAHLPEGAQVGVALPEDGQPVNQFLRLDPFFYQVQAVGERLNLLEERKPRYLLRESKTLQDSPVVAGYNPLARFGAGGGLPRDQIGLFQDEIYQVFERKSRAEPAVGPALWEEALGRLVRQDPDAGFTLLSYQALRFFPITVNLFRKLGRSLAPFPTSLFTGSLRHESSPVAYVHHIGRTALSLWGVKYLWVKVDGSFTENVLEGGYPLEPVELPGLGPSSHPGLTAYRYRGYRGQAFFVADEPWQTQTATRRLWRAHPLPGAGRLLARCGAGAAEVRLVVASDGPVDVILKGGPVRSSFVLGEGRSVLLAPYQSEAEVEYEINPVKAGDQARLLEASARPMLLETAPRVSRVSTDPGQAFAAVDAPAPGRVLFALPWHEHWTAEVDGQAAQPEPGPAGVTAVPVPAGSHFVALTFKR